MRLSEIIIKVTTALGASEAKMRWRLHKLGMWTEKTARKTEVKKEQITYAHKKCGACRALNDRDDSVCSSCGEPLRWRVSHMLERAGVGPLASTSALLIALLVITYGVAIASIPGSFEVRHATLEMRAMVGLTYAPSWHLIALPFVHVTLVGVLATCLVVFLVGQEIESLYGRFVMLAWFAITASAGAVAHRALFDSLMFGASSGLCGMIMVGVVAGHRLHTHAGRELRNLMIKWAICVYAVLLLLQGNIVGELIAGALGAIIGGVVRPSWTRGSLVLHVVLAIIALALLGTGAAIAIVDLGIPNLFLY